MSNVVFESKMSDRKTHFVTLKENGVRMLSAELEIMVDEDDYLKKIAGAAALLVARLDRVSLQGGTAMAAFTLAGLINGMPEDMMSDAIRMISSS